MTDPDYGAALARINERIDRRALAVRIEIATMYRAALRAVCGRRSAGQRLRRRNTTNREERRA